MVGDSGLASPCVPAEKVGTQGQGQAYVPLTQRSQPYEPRPALPYRPPLLIKTATHYPLLKAALFDQLPRRCRGLLLLAGLLTAASAAGQTGTIDKPLTPADSTVGRTETDMSDVARRLLPRLFTAPPDTATVAPGRRYTVLLPAVSYSLATGGLAQVASSTAFRRPGANMSSVVASLAYTQNNQLVFSTISSVWMAANRYYLVADWRLMHYPLSTYGLGMHTTVANAIPMDYKYLRLHQSVLRRLRPGLYAGLGYQLDYHWGITSQQNQRPVSTVSDHRQGVQGSSTSSGVALTLLYDSRSNGINAEAGGTYLNLLVRSNNKLLGSEANYQSLILDARRYLRLRPGSRNVLALWSYDAIVFGGQAPFLDLPGTGWDTYSNTGRGYIQGRFRGQGFLYAEAEYRYGITHNGLLGGVVFANVQSASEPRSQRFDAVAPAAGVGLRLNINKHTRTNLAVDYGVGMQGSRGLFFNFGEVF